MSAAKLSLLLALVFLVASAVFSPFKSNNFMENTNQQKVNVWDTYVTRKDSQIMHFDIIAPVEVQDTNIIYNYGKAYLKTKGQEGQPLTAKQCRLCHIEQLRPAWEKEINEKGYFIIEMEGCD